MDDLDPLPTEPKASSTAYQAAASFVAVAAAAGLLMVLLGNGMIGGRPAGLTLVMGVVLLTLAGIALGVTLIVQMTAVIQRLGTISRRISDATAAVRVLSEQAALSDDARRVVNRMSEREMLRRAIQTDIDNRDWEAGLVLCKELAERFGYRADAEEFRARIDEARAFSVEKDVREGIAEFEGALLQRRFDAAGQLGRKLSRLYPEEPRVQSLGARLVGKREEFKRELLGRFAAVQESGNPEEAMNVLREMDAQLTPAEAEPIREQARQVIARYRDHLADLFRVAVADEDWADAASLGKRITAEFPNTKMAGEVRTMMETILARANQAG